MCNSFHQKVFLVRSFYHHIIYTLWNLVLIYIVRCSCNKKKCMGTDIDPANDSSYPETAKLSSQ